MNGESPTDSSPKPSSSSQVKKEVEQPDEFLNLSAKTNGKLELLPEDDPRAIAVKKKSIPTAVIRPTVRNQGQLEGQGPLLLPSATPVVPQAGPTGRRNRNTTMSNTGNQPDEMQRILLEIRRKLGHLHGLLVTLETQLRELMALVLALPGVAVATSPPSYRDNSTQTPLEFPNCVGNSQPNPFVPLPAPAPVPEASTSSISIPTDVSTERPSDSD